VAPPKPALERGVDIFRLIGEAVVVAVMGSPPQGTSLDGSVAGHRKQELPETVGFECPMREITVIESRDGEHTNEIESRRHGHGGPAPADHEYEETSDMQEQKGQDADPVDA